MKRRVPLSLARRAATGTASVVMISGTTLDSVSRLDVERPAEGEAECLAPAVPATSTSGIAERQVWLVHAGDEEHRQIELRDWWR